jgi:membrane protein DedA with SNARE-associated domain
VNDILDWLLTTVQSVDPATRNILAGLAIMLETSLFVGLVMPGDTVVLVASTGVTELSDFFWLLGSVLLGSLLGESFGFWIGRLFGERIRASKLGQKIGEKNWRMADAFIESRGGLAVAISRFLPVLHSLVPVVSGATKMRYRVFIRWTFAACAVWASAYVGVGYLAKSSYEQIGSSLKFGGLIFVAIILVFVTIVHFAKKRLEKTAVKMVEEDKASQFKDLEG